MSDSRNVISWAAVDSFIDHCASARPDHMQRWWRTVARNHLMRVWPVCRVRDKSEAPDIPRLEVIPDEVYFMDTSDQPDWVKRDLAAEREVHVLVPTWYHNQIGLVGLINDYLHTLPEREIRISFPDIERQTRQWHRSYKMSYDKKLAATGTRIIPVWCLQRTDYTVVELGTELAFKAEGSDKNHCVGSYWPRSYHGLLMEKVAEFTSGTGRWTQQSQMLLCRYVEHEIQATPRIYSLRQKGKPVVTIEVCNKSIMQVQGTSNSGYPSELRPVLVAIARELGWTEGLESNLDSDGTTTIMNAGTRLRWQSPLFSMLSMFGGQRPGRGMDYGAFRFLAQRQMLDVVRFGNADD